MAGFAAGLRYPDVGSVLAGAEALLSIGRAASKTREAAGANSGPRVVMAARDGRPPIVDELAGRLRRVGRDRLPVVMVVDDAHDADESLAALLEQVFIGPMPVGMLCLCTAWPERLAQQTCQEGSFGHWLSRAVERFPDRITWVPLDRLPDDAIGRRAIPQRRSRVTGCGASATSPRSRSSLPPRPSTRCAVRRE
jgi:hypothetical protein